MENSRGGHAADKRGHVKQRKAEAKQKTAGTARWTCNPRILLGILSGGHATPGGHEQIVNKSI
ncbi:MAG: hypothetical protein GXW91_08800 [Clostridiales bacterium]|nr:hypothetical protein [Clostridiales bacterium]